MLVMLFHYGITLDLNPENKLALFFGHGWSGVDMFFIISGFIAAYTVGINVQGYRAGIEYLFKRIIRIVPLYYLVTILSAGHSLESFIETGKSLLFIPLGGLPPDSYGPLYGGARVGQGWTLNYEIYFYLVIAISIFFGRAKWLIASGFIVLTVLLPLLMFGFPANYGFSGFYFKYNYINLMTNPIILEFIIGILICFIYKKMSKKITLTWVVLIIASATYFLINYFSPILTNSRVAMWGLPAAALTLALLKLELITEFKYPKILIRLGNISFSIYLLHNAVSGVLLKLIKHITNNVNIFTHIEARIILFTLSIVGTLYLSCLSYRYIESSLTCFKNSLFCEKTTLRSNLN
ncbi:acyltransferase [Pantoea sp. JZ2]|uniref:acyltransferase family protein n=1 Tax=Pantoea sp. JZ2 TaxID=2654189 RepID=UPI002B4A9A03|nr:acyltransferase [Pantoea sp. JZ2]